MPTSRTIAFRHLRKSDQFVFNGLVSQLAEKTNNLWQISKEEYGDINVVDVDTSEGAEFAENLIAQGRRVIRIGGNNFHGNQAHYLQKPLRSADIIACIRSIFKSPAKAESPENLSLRFRKWPSKELIRACPGSSRLIAVLMRRGSTLKQATEAAGLSIHQATLFIDKCKHQGCVEVLGYSTNDLNDKHLQLKQKHSTLFSRLRQKFSGKTQ